MSVLRLPALFCFFASWVLSPNAHADDWHPNDETFDPSVESVIVEGSTRLGDPTPFHKDGYPTQSYTVIEAKPDQAGGATVNFSLIVPITPGTSAPAQGGSLFLSIEQAKGLIILLKQAIEKPEDSREVGKVFEEGYYQQYTVLVDPGEKGPVVLKHEMNDTEASFRFDVSPTKKLIHTLEIRLEEAKKITSEN